MRLPWVSRDRYEEMKGHLTYQVEMWQKRHDSMQERLIGLLEPTDPPPDEDLVPIPDLPEIIERAMYQRAKPATFTWEGLRDYALEQMRLGVEEEKIAQNILEGGSL